ncbi:Bgt-20265 [Blumeria graminis f. sp. tritici]|uniref:Bgt-20265 n=2 Tax=Blumeria graminis f. sp. tritici TaxID=62690 RepID=A0A9X9MNA5_BLUGR|nr:Bgt-20265 [Blumeria graminis f. sp. tritici]
MLTPWRNIRQESSAWPQLRLSWIPSLGFSPIVTAFAVGNTNAAILQGKNPSLECTQLKTSISRATKSSEKPLHELLKSPRRLFLPRPQ